MTATTEREALRLPWWVAGDTNAFFGLGFNTLVNVLVLSGLCVGVLNIPGADVQEAAADAASRSGSDTGAMLADLALWLPLAGGEGLVASH